MAAVGTCTMTASGARDARTYIFALTTDSSTGAVSGIPLDTPAGLIRAIKVVPGAAAVQPTDLFDLTILDADGLDILSGAGSNLTNAAPTLFQVDPPLFHDGGTLAMTVANGGNSKTLTIKVTEY